MKHLLLLILILLPLVSFTQNSDIKLAQHYYSSGEYDKAIVYYERLYRKNPNKYFFKRYYTCLVETNQIKDAEKLLKRAYNRHKNDSEYGIMLADFYETYNDPEKADKIYSELIDHLRPFSSEIIRLYNAFKRSGKHELAYRTLVKGRKLLKNSYPLNIQFADYYGSQGETEKMIKEYLDLLEYHPGYYNSVKRLLSNRIDFTEEDSEEYEILKKELILRSQKNTEKELYSNMLIWLFSQRKNFPAALIHVKALDKRTVNDGSKVYQFGKTCTENRDFPTAKKAFQYVMSLGQDKPYYTSAQNALLNVSFLEITTQRNFSNDEIQQVIRKYQQIIEKQGFHRKTLPIIMQAAHIEAFYGEKAKDAILLLQKALKIPGLTDMQRAEIKMKLADIYLLNGDMWEASLLYMQIDKDFKYEPIGHEAKFKNAKIFYYDGEFDFAQSQLDVLKQSTSKLIANNALNLSVMITDNYGLDSNYTAMYWFAQADLLITQHQYDKAFQYFDSIEKQFPAHSLGDEILMKKAEAKQQQGKWNEAILHLEELLKYYGFDLLADDALYQIAIIYDKHLFQEEKAAEYYRKILFEHKGSIYTPEVRKRLKEIRNKNPKP